VPNNFCAPHAFGHCFQRGVSRRQAPFNQIQFAFSQVATSFRRSFFNFIASLIAIVIGHLENRACDVAVRV